MMKAHRYVGIPFRERGRSRDGVDCWGLVVLVYREALGLDLPSYAGRYRSTADADELDRLIRGEMGPWVEVPLGAERPYDCLLIRMRGRPVHVGLVVRRGAMLHAEAGVGVAIEEYLRPKWARRVVGAFRHRALAAHEAA